MNWSMEFGTIASTVGFDTVRRMKRHLGPRLR